MEKPTLTVPQRKALVELLQTDRWSECLWKAAKEKYEDTRNLRRKDLVRESSGAVGELVEELISLREKISALKEKVIEHDDSLARRGFSVDADGGLSVRSSSPLYKTIEQELDGELGTLESVVTLPFKRAAAKLWTVATAEEADKLVEPFLDFKVRS